MNIKALIGSAAVLGCLMSTSVFAQSLPASCGVRVTSATGMRFYEPTGLNGARVNILGWANGTGGGATTYSSLLNAAAARCVLVAAATTGSAGSGTATANAVNAARTRFAGILRSPLRICTSGHSQGGSGSFNAANILGAAAVQCVIGVQPDTVITASIQRALAPTVDTTCIFSTSDTLAPASRNAGNCRRNATIYKQVTTSGGHFGPTGTNGGAPGTAQRNEINRLLR